MGKPYDHQYFFSGSGCSNGTMVCRHCNQPIFNHSQDWMSYKKSKRYDWSFHCFHRKCVDDQAGWEKIENAREKENRDHQIKMNILKEAALSIGVSDPYEYAILAAESLGEYDLGGHYFDIFGSS